MYNAPYYLMVVAAGNDGNTNYNGSPLDGQSGYDKLTGHSTSKNNLVVANAQDANIDSNGNLISVSINSSSSEGPTDDYRIKPDITGNGTSLYSTYHNSNTAYNSISGTSMASPNVTGTLLLLQQHYNNINGSFMRAATLKGLALHTADDVGPTGPDAVYGWGLLNAKRAAEVISDNNVNSLVQELTLAQGQTYSFTVQANGLDDLMASISWTDPAGTATSQTNSTAARLVNDLDIRVSQGATTYMPYRLTSVTTNGLGDNTRDPFERIAVASAVGTYTVTITHKGTLSGGNQNYSLIITGATIGAPDTEAPSTPQNLIASNETETTINLSWDAATDNVGVVAYKVFQDGNQIASVSATQHIVTGLNPDTSYTFEVQAIDGAGNASALSASVTASTLAETLDCHATISSYNYQESFESNFGDWIQSNTDDIDWSRDSNGTPSNNTGPASASDGSTYIYVEASGNGTGYPNKQAILTSPCFDLSSETTANFKFDYHMYGSNDMGSISIQASTNGADWTTIWSKTGNQGNTWNNESLDMTAYLGGSVQLRLNRITGGTWQADVALDNLMMDTNQGGGGTACNNGVTVFPYGESFENSLGVWTQEPNDDIDWTRDANGTPSRNTGPSNAADGSFYMYVEASGNGTGYPNKRAILNSPCIDLSLETAAVFNFNYHMYGSSNMGSLSVEASTDGSTWEVLWSQTGNLGNSWQTQSLDLSSYLGGSVQLRFNRLTGSTWQADVAIDNVQIDTSGNNPPPSNYCASNGQNTSDEYISRVQIGSIDNITGASSGGYGNFTNLSTTLAASNTITITPTWTGTVYAEGYAVYIDWNRDGDFTDSGELVFSRSATTASSVTGTFGIPTGASIGLTRMRVSMMYNDIPEPCESFRWGEVEDYIVEIGAGTNSTLDEGLSTLNNTGNNLNNVRLRVYPNPVSTQALHLELLGAEGRSYQILNMLGQTIAQGNFTREIQVNKLASGAYFIQVQTTKGLQTVRFIKK